MNKRVCDFVGEIIRSNPYVVNVSIPVAGYDPIEFTLTKECGWFYSDNHQLCIQIFMYWKLLHELHQILIGVLEILQKMGLMQISVEIVKEYQYWPIFPSLHPKSCVMFIPPLGYAIEIKCIHNRDNFTLDSIGLILDTVENNSKDIYHKHFLKIKLVE